MAGLAQALAKRGRQVIYCASQTMSPARKAQGWEPPSISPAKLQLVPDIAALDRFLETCPDDAIHICQGLRGNGLVGEAQKKLRQRGRKHWVVMETIDDQGPKGVVKRQAYRCLLAQWEPHLHGVLAIGRQTSAWLERCGFSAKRIFPFAYFLSNDVEGTCRNEVLCRSYQLIFVGQMIPRKRLDHLIRALAPLKPPI